MRFNRKSFDVKLWTYFAMFSVLIFLVLWLLQTVFLQKFYDGMVIRNVEDTAESIIRQYDSEDIESIMNELSRDNSLLIFLTDVNGEPFFSSDPYNDRHKNSREEKLDNEPGNVEKLSDWKDGVSRKLPREFDDFLEKLAESTEGIVRYRNDTQKNYVYGAYLPDSEKRESILYISASLDAVGSTVSIIRMQLIWVTLLSLCLGFFVAFMISKRFSRPIEMLSIQAKKIAKGDFEVTFEKGFCWEMDQLSDTLEDTAEELRKSENYRRELLANVSHDLRTPLTMIKGYAELIRDISGEDPEERKEDLAIILRETDRLSNLVEEILEYSALQAERHFCELIPTDIGMLAETVVRQFQTLWEHDGYQIHTFIENGQIAGADSAHLARVFYNLIDNAVSHSGAEKWVDVTVKGKDDQVRVEVRDYGVGVREEELPYIWDRYFTSRQRKCSHQGSGLGLAIAKEILTDHEALFGAENCSDGGCRFWFELKKTKESSNL
ncbi:MAG: ATP-binding protein [Muricoprocola sp.]